MVLHGLALGYPRHWTFLTQSLCSGSSNKELSEEAILTVRAQHNQGFIIGSNNQGKWSSHWAIPIAIMSDKEGKFPSECLQSLTSWGNTLKLLVYLH